MELSCEPQIGLSFACTPGIDAAPSHSSEEVPSPGHELANPSEKIVLKVLTMAKISVTAAAPRCKHLCGFVDEKMDAQPLAGVRPASGCGSIRCGNSEALSGVFSCSNELPCLHDSCVDCGACRVSHSVCSRSNDQRAASAGRSINELCSCCIYPVSSAQQLFGHGCCISTGGFPCSRC